MLGIMTSVLCGLCWGIASFSSGRSSRAISAPLVTAMYNALGVVFFGLLFAFSEERSVLSDSSVLSRALVTGIVGGIGFSVGLVCIARGMSRGRAGIISPLIAVVSIILPVVYTIASGDSPDIIALFGIAVLLVVPWLAARTHAVTASHVTRSIPGDVMFGVVSGAGFGVYYISMMEAPDKAQLFMLTVIQLTSMIGMLITHIASGASWSIPVQARKIVVVFLVFELLGVIFLRTSLNLVSGAVVAAVSGILDPMGILVLSRIYNKELFTKPQIIGFALMLVGIALVSLNAQ